MFDYNRSEEEEDIKEGEEEKHPFSKYYNIHLQKLISA